MWLLYVLQFPLLSLSLSVGMSHVTEQLKDTCTKENWTILNLKVIQDEDDIKRISSNKCAITLQNPPSGALTKTVMNLLPKQSLKILQITGKLKSFDEETISSMRFLKHVKMSDVDLKNSEIIEGNGEFTKNIETLDISNNDLQNLTFFKTESSKMKRINLNNNLLSTVPNELKVFTRLKQLSMTKNKIHDISLRFSLIHVEYLDLSYNSITNLSGLHYFPNLVVLNLTSNSIHQINDEYFESERSDLEELFLDNNYIEFIPIRTLCNLPNLKTFSIANNKLRKLIPTTDNFQFTKLQYLNLEENRLDEIPYNFLKWFPLLQILKINNNNLSYLRTGTFANLNNLVNLDISHNEIVDLDVKRFIPLESLSVLNISHNKIKNIDYISLTLGIPNLKVFNIDGNSLSCENLMEMLNFFENDDIQVQEGECEGREHIKGICCVDTVMNYTDTKFNMAYYEMIVENREISKKLNDLFKAIKNISVRNEDTLAISNESIIVTKTAFWTGLGIIIAVLFFILLALIFGLVMKRTEVVPVHL